LNDEYVVKRGELHEDQSSCRSVFHSFPDGTDGFVCPAVGFDIIGAYSDESQTVKRNYLFNPWFAFLRGMGIVNRVHN
jgi:hypothetical protein